MNAALLLAAVGALSLLVSWPLAAQGDGFGCSLGEDERELKFDTNTDIKTFPASAFNRNKHYHIILDAEATEVVIELQTFSKDILIETTSNAKIGRIVFPELTEADELIFELSNSKQATTIEFPKLKDASCITVDNQDGKNPLLRFPVLETVEDVVIRSQNDRTVTVELGSAATPTYGLCVLLRGPLPLSSSTHSSTRFHFCLFFCICAMLYRVV